MQQVSSKYKNVTWDPCWSQTTRRGTGNLSFIIKSESSWGARSNWANACKNIWPKLTKLTMQQ